MFRGLYPNKRVKSSYGIDYEAMMCKGYRAVIFDIDNTLVRHGAPVDDNADRLFAHLRDIGLKYFILSNNKERRVKPFADRVGSRYIHKAGKPSPINYLKAAELMGETEETTFFVGDQLFTDIWGANRAHMYSFLVKPINPKEEIQIILKRIPEKIILLFYSIYRKFQGEDQ